MSVLFLVLPLALVLVAGAVAAFVWAVRQGQFDDLSTPSVRMLHDDPAGAPRVPTPSPHQHASCDQG